MASSRRWSRSAGSQLRYLWALLRRFKVTFLMLAAVQLGGSLTFFLGYARAGRPVSFPKAMGATYFLMMGQPSLELPDTWAMTAVTALIPVLGIAVVADGLVRFGYLFFAKHRNDKEWIAVQAASLKDHVVLCGAGRVGYRVLEQLLKLDVDVVVLERNENAPFVQAVRSLGVPLLVDDGRARDSLDVVNIKGAQAIVCATDDDLANLNIALDARRLNPEIRVVMRLFDEDLLAKVRDAFVVEALSTSALAAPAFAAAALDPSIHTSFDLDGELTVVAELKVGASLAGLSAARLRDEHGATLLKIARGGKPFATAPSSAVLMEGDSALLQAPLESYRRLARSKSASAAG